jgi:hypothetical protein
VAKKKSTSHTKSKTPAIVGGVIGGIVALFTVIGIAAFVQRRRRRQSRPMSILSDSMEGSSDMMMVTPYNTVSYETIQDSRTWAEQQPLVSENPGVEMFAPHDLSSTPPTVPPRSRPVAPFPVGLSDKEIARLRAETLGSQHPHNNSTSNASLTTSNANTAAESSGATSSYDPRRLHTEVESLRREVELLRTEGVVPGAPPSYTEGDGQSNGY